MTHRDDSGNVQVDFVWGNLPMQPNDDRDDITVYTAGVENEGWSGTEVIYSDTLRTSDYNVTHNNLSYKVPADNHINATIGWSNFPGYIENYAGDGDSGLEAVVPNVVRMHKEIGRDLINSLNLDFTNNYVNPGVLGVVSTGTTIRVYVNNLYGLKVGDTVFADNTAISFPDYVTITSTGVDGDPYLEVVVTQAPDPAISEEADGTIWPYGEMFDVILQQDIPAGEIVDEGTSIEITMLGD